MKVKDCWFTHTPAAHSGTQRLMTYPGLRCQLILSAQCGKWCAQLAVAFSSAARRFVVKVFFYLNVQLFLLRPFSERSLSGSAVSRQPTVCGASRSRSLECSGSPSLNPRRSRQPEPELSTLSLSSTSRWVLGKYLLHSAPCSGIQFWVLK